MDMEGKREKKFITEFLSVHEQHSCLWSAQSSAYKNKQQRNVAYEELLKKAQEYYPTANQKYVSSKIANLRSAFRRELRKVAKSKKTGSGAEEIYKPTLWYYDLLLFTAEDEIGRIGITSEDSDFNDDSTISDYNDFNESDSVPESSPPVPVQEFSPTPTLRTSTPAGHGASIRKPVSLKRKKENLIELATKHLSAESSDEKITGLKIGSQLKNMTSEQCLLAEKYISDIMYYGQVNKLYEGCFQYIDSLPVSSKQTHQNILISKTKDFPVIPSTSHNNKHTSNFRYTVKKVNVPSTSYQSKHRIDIESPKKCLAEDKKKPRVVILSQKAITPAGSSLFCLPNSSSSRSNKDQYDFTQDLNDYLIFPKKSNNDDGCV